ncbi:MAG: thioredoxin family protein [Chloroflexi bacterium]|nr:thioredoxin family protein [Ardenticatenaceae bacterium]NOG37039.1 thioredoxin family protein [Chloroflexota bacterium]
MDGLAAEWGDTVTVLRVNVQDPTAQPLLAELNFRFTPTFILFDGDGREIWRTNGVINPDEVHEQLDRIP